MHADCYKAHQLGERKSETLKSDSTYNPQFEHANPSLLSVLAKHNRATDLFLMQVKCYFSSGISFYVMKTIICHLIESQKELF